MCNVADLVSGLLPTPLTPITPLQATMSEMAGQALSDRGLDGK